MKVFYKNKQLLRNKIEKLSRGLEWTCEMFTMKENVLDLENGKCKVYTFELWKCDLVECIKELLSNPAF